MDLRCRKTILPCRRSSASGRGGDGGDAPPPDVVVQGSSSLDEMVLIASISISMFVSGGNGKNVVFQLVPE